jgi:hypothetical protein
MKNLSNPRWLSLGKSSFLCPNISKYQTSNFKISAGIDQVQIDYHQMIASDHENKHSNQESYPSNKLLKDVVIEQDQITLKDLGRILNIEAASIQNTF